MASHEPVILFRPVGQRELDLIRETGFPRFPPRLPFQPIFYPVLTEDYATRIARDWNTKDAASGFVGYVTMVYLLVVLIWPRIRVIFAAGAALLVCFAIEVAKLDQSPWLVAFRHTTAGGLILGHVFTPANFACYVVGVLIGVLLDLALDSRPSERRSAPVADAG